jgi:hypothetical protein
MRHRKTRTFHQTAAQRLADHVLSADLTPAFDGGAAQDNRPTMAEVDR